MISCANSCSYVKLFVYTSDMSDIPYAGFHSSLVPFGRNSVGPHRYKCGEGGGYLYIRVLADGNFA